jgi:hypothetical protein
LNKPAGITRDKLLAAVQRGERSQLQIRHCKHQSGVDFVDVRLWTRSWGSEPYRPGKGITLRLEELAAVAEALETVKQG